MRANRGKDTGPELVLRSVLWRHGLRYRVSVRPLPDARRTADMVFRPNRVAVFVDGCFWHGCPQHYSVPVAHGGFWKRKVRRNQIRDADTTKLLKAAGWTVVRIWEHELAEQLDACAEKVIGVIERSQGV